MLTRLSTKKHTTCSQPVVRQLSEILDTNRHLPATSVSLETEGGEEHNKPFLVYS